MKVVWLSWKDREHPQAGGAELVSEGIARRLVADGHEVVMVTSGFAGAAASTTRHGVQIVRVGNRWSVYYHAWRYYQKYLRDWADVVVEEVNTIPFFSRFYSGRPGVMVFYQLCRQIWFYQLPFPLGIVGYLAEPLYVRLLRDRPVLTCSESTRQDLARHGFDPSAVQVFTVGPESPAPRTLPANPKFRRPTMLSLGSVRPMKRTQHQVRAFELAKQHVPDLQLIIAGSAEGAYGEKMLKMIEASPYRADIQVMGRVSEAQKTLLMRRSHLIVVTSVKEGWGLIVTEAARQGTPAVVYDIDGLRDSVRHGKTGLVCTPQVKALASSVVELLARPEAYEKMRRRAWENARIQTLDKGYKTFAKVLRRQAAKNMHRTA